MAAIGGHSEVFEWCCCGMVVDNSEVSSLLQPSAGLMGETAKDGVESDHSYRGHSRRIRSAGANGRSEDRLVPQWRDLFSHGQKEAYFSVNATHR